MNTECGAVFARNACARPAGHDGPHRTEWYTIDDGGEVRTYWVELEATGESPHRLSFYVESLGDRVGYQEWLERWAGLDKEVG